MSAILDIYPSPIEGGDYLAQLQFTSDSNTPLPISTTAIQQQQIRTILIVDQSGSMGHYVTWLIKQVFPSLFSTLKYNPNDEIDLILFESNTHYYKHKVSEFPSLNYSAEGGTMLHGVFPKLQEILSTLQPGSSVRLLTISDGDVFLQDEAVKLATELNEYIQSNTILNIQSSALRLFTSTYANPDCRALSSLLQYTNTGNEPGLVDFTPQCSIDPPGPIVETLLTVFGSDITAGSYLCYNGLYNDMIQSLHNNNNNNNPNNNNEQEQTIIDNPHSMFKVQPWSNIQPFIQLTQKSTLFWIDVKKFNIELLQTLMISDQIPVYIQLHEKLDSTTYEELFQSRMNYYMMKIKLLRVVDTTRSITRLQEMSNYFTTLESQLYSDFIPNDGILPNQLNLTLIERVIQLKKKLRQTNKRLGLQMKQIANMDATTKFNSAQAATFLRSVGTTKASKGLVRRAGDALDFDSIVRSQVREMAKNLYKLEELIPSEIESKFHQSFVSLATTMDGIRTICSLATTTIDGDIIPLEQIDIITDTSLLSILDTLPAYDILSYLNLVGVPVQSTIGDYPDPYKYHINIIFSGHYCSLSDIMSSHSIQETTNGNTIVNNLTVPGFKGDNGRIDNVIPIFESPHIFQFLYTHAPSVLNYYSSIGMRRVIADINGTLPATLSASLLKMFKMIMIEPTEVNFITMQNIYTSLKRCSSWKYNAMIFKEILNAMIFSRDEPLYLANTLEQLNKDKIKNDIVDNGNDIDINPDCDEDGDDRGNDNKVIVPEENSIQNGKIETNVTTTPPTTTSKITHTKPSITPQLDYPTLPRLPSIVTPLTQLLVPLLQIMTFIEDNTIPNQFIDFLNNQSYQHTQSITIELFTTHLPTIFRAIYTNETWIQLRSIYRGKEDAPDIISNALKSLVGFDSTTWKVPISDDIFIEDPQFTTTMIPNNDMPINNGFYSSDIYNKYQHVLNRLNILLSLPYFVKLLHYDMNNINNQKLKLNELLSSVPKLIATPETINLLKQQREMNALRNLLEQNGQLSNPNQNRNNNNNNDDNDNDNVNAAINIDIDNDYIDQLDMNNIDFGGELIVYNSYQQNQKQLQETVTKSVHLLFQQVLFGHNNITDPTQIDLFIAQMKLLSILHSFIYIYPYQRYDLTVPNDTSTIYASHIPDYPKIIITDFTSDVFFSSQIQLQSSFYELTYYNAVQSKTLQRNVLLASQFIDELLQVDDITLFKQYLSNGLPTHKQFPFIFQSGSRDIHFQGFWNKITDVTIASNTIPLRHNKIRILLLGTDEDNTIIWNAGQIIRADLTNVAKVFQMDNQLELWNQIIQIYTERKKSYSYRVEPNRHGHNNDLPSFWALGYLSLEAYRKAVSPIEFNEYIQKHSNCCGVAQFLADQTFSKCFEFAKE